MPCLDLFCCGFTISDLIFPLNLHRYSAGLRTFDWLRTCMSGLHLLAEAVRTALSAIRLAVDGLELALNRIVAAPPNHVDLESQPSVSTHRSWEVLLPTPEAPSTPTATAPVLRSSPAASNYSTDSYHEVAASIPPLPDHLLDLCSRLVGPRDQIVYRAKRAWEAGVWARATLEGLVPKPRPTPKLAIRPCVYLIVRGPGIHSPRRVSTAAEFFRLLPVFTQDSLSHSFPSIAEAKVYCAAIGIDLPDQQ